MREWKGGGERRKERNLTHTKSSVLIGSLRKIRGVMSRLKKEYKKKKNNRYNNNHFFE